MARVVKKPEVRKEEIIKTARHLFLTKSYEKTTMQDIMDALDIAKGTIYHYFKSKEELIEKVIEDLIDRAAEKVKKVIDNAKGTALQIMEMIFSSSSEIAREERDIIGQLHKPGNITMHTRLLVNILIAFAPIYEKVIKQGNSEKIFKVENPLECAEFMLFAIHFLTYRGIHPWSDADLERRIQAFPKLLEHLFQAPAGSFQFVIKEMKRTVEVDLKALSRS